IGPDEYTDYELKLENPVPQAGRGETPQGRGGLRKAGIGVKIRPYLNRVICSLRSWVSRRLRGELRKRSRFFSFRINNQGPFPRTAARIAHNVMRNRDQGLCVRGF